MSTVDALNDFAQSHQTRECELRRQQNQAASQSIAAYVGIVDSSWSSLAEADAPMALRTPHHGVIPISDQAPSNWHIGSDIPFALVPSDNPNVTCHDDGSLRYVWLVFKQTSYSGFLCIHPDGERVFIEWGEHGILQLGSYVFRAFDSKEEADDWVKVTVIERTF